jgi:hypothetical protein
MGNKYKSEVETLQLRDETERHTDLEEGLGMLGSCMDFEPIFPSVWSPGFLASLQLMRD